VVAGFDAARIGPSPLPFVLRKVFQNKDLGFDLYGKVFILKVYTLKYSLQAA
jgi:hypothetical protein